MAHLDTHLLWIYALLLAIVFAEIVSVVTPFLPGDSLLFINGALAVNDALPLVAI